MLQFNHSAIIFSFSAVHPIRTLTWRLGEPAHSNGQLLHNREWKIQMEKWKRSPVGDLAVFQPNHMTITKHMMHACGAQSPSGENETAHLFMGRNIKEAKQSSQCVCVGAGRKAKGFMSHLPKLRSLRDISASVKLGIITHTHRYTHAQHVCARR